LGYCINIIGKPEKKGNSYMLGVKLDYQRSHMNPENYKINRNKPKRNSAITRAKEQMLAKPKINAVGTPKLRAIYSNKTEWVTKVIPKQKEKQ
jgi:hypothetical protein